MYTQYTLGDVCSRLSSGKSISASEVTDKGLFSVYGGNGLRGYTDKSNFTGECAIIGRQGAFCGNVHYFSGEAYMTEHAVVVCANEEHNTRYLAYLLSQMNLGRLSGQSAQPGLSVKTLAKQCINLPPLEIQNKIVSVLASLDSKIDCNQKINDNLELQAQSLVTEYIEKTPYTTHLSDIITFDNGFAFQSKTYLKQGKYKIITIKNVQDGRIDSTGTAFINELPQRMRENCILSIGDILLSLTGNVGRVGIVYEKNLLLNQRVARVVPFDKQLLPFLYFVFRQPSIKTQLEMIAKGTAQLNLSPIEALNLTISYEQSSATALSQSLEALYKIIISNQQENLLLAQLRDTLLPKLMSGKIDVSSVQL